MPKDRLYVTIFKGENGVPRDEEATHSGWSRAFPRSASARWGRRTTSGRWAIPARAARAPRSSTTWASKRRRLPGKDKPFGEDDARYVEIWNLVFMQFDRSAQGELSCCPSPPSTPVLGLERIAAVLQGKLSNFETDLLFR